MFDALKKAYTRMSGGEEPTPLASMAFGVCSAFCGQLVAFPLETVARRMQVSLLPLKPAQHVQVCCFKALISLSGPLLGNGFVSIHKVWNLRHFERCSPESQESLSLLRHSEGLNLASL
jgi:hypothetical protein